MIYILEVRAFLSGHAWPEITHRFAAPTREGAIALFHSHLKVDEALRGCFERKRTPDGTLCRLEAAWLD